MFLPQEIIRKKRDGLTLEAHEIEAFIGGLTDGRVTEGQAAAFAMAVFLRGMTNAECAALTAFDRRHRRQYQPDPGPGRRGLRRLCADDFGTWPRPHRRHAGQA